MSSFFDSEIIQDELKEINEIQEFLYSTVFTFGSLSSEEKIDHIDKMTELLDKQKILYARLSLSDDPEAKEMKERILDSATMLGLPKGTDMNIVFNNMSQMLEVMKDQIDKTGSDL